MTKYEDKSQHPDAPELNARAYENGCSLYRSAHYDSAKSSFELALEYQPGDGRTWFALGNCHDQMKNPARAEVCFKMSLKFAGPDAKSNVCFNLGNSLLDQGKLDEAIESYSEVGTESPAYDAAQKNIALARRKID